MPFSILLLNATSSKRHITGYGGDRVSMEGNLKPGELALFFQIDKPEVREALNMFTNDRKMKCCDGLIFYSQDDEEEKTICLVEMKSGKLHEAEEQIKATRDHLLEILQKECKNSKASLQKIRWKACIYRSGSSGKQTDIYREKLEKTYGFGKGNVTILGQSDISSFLRRTKKGRA